MPSKVLIRNKSKYNITLMKLYFRINYKTKHGERLVLQVADNKNGTQIHDLYCQDQDKWSGEVDYQLDSIHYKYQILDAENVVVDEEIVSHQLFLGYSFKEYQINDVWNNKNFPENYLNNKIFHNQLKNFKNEKTTVLKKHTHLFRIEAPLYHQDWKILMIGDAEELGNWAYDKAVKLTQVNPGVWEVSVEINSHSSILYKYGIYNETTQEVVFIESGENRVASSNPNPDVLNILADHYFKFDDATLWHAAGVAIPVFSLRTKNGFGVGEFLDLKNLADWAKKSALEILQILPINDTTANYTWTDSYPYAAISVYALHPQYLAVDRLSYALPKSLEEGYLTEKNRLNNLSLVDYEAVISGKWKFIKAVFKENEKAILKDKGFAQFIEDNKEWLMPYAAFCVLRDKYKTPNYNLWKTHKKYVAAKVASLYNSDHKDYAEVMLHAWVQYQLHLQLTEAVEYAHQLGISVKGDLPIGIYRHSVEAWTEPELFGMDFQAGAPPDQFSDLGQNWEFPTYNWEVMQADGYQWWKKRFKVLERYFDAMRIDHILGFFRIWRMPISATQGLLGYFYPAIPVTDQELMDRHINFDKARFCEPFINDEILNTSFGDDKNWIIDQFLEYKDHGIFVFKEAYKTQRLLANYFKKNPLGDTEESLLSLAANVLFIIEETAEGDVYHPRFNLEKTSSFFFMPQDMKQKLVDLYNNYFFERQDDLWYHKAMEKLPALLQSTDMLICGEDLGLVPNTVPVVMDKLAITALKVQRMPSDNIPFYNPKDASYLNVVTASSHDSSTLRQWWHEDRDMTQNYFNQQLHQFGTAPWDLTPEFSEIIMKQHLYTDAMLAIFPMQEFLATDERLMNVNMDEERINNPAVFPHYWRYRMHLDLEDLTNEKEFNQKIGNWIKESGRI